MIENNGAVITITPVSMDDIMANLAVTSNNASLITADILRINHKYPIGAWRYWKTFHGFILCKHLDQTMVNAKNAAGGFSDNMEAAKHNFLLRGYYKKKEEKERKDSLQLSKDGNKK